MNLSQFNSLDDKKREALIWKRGIFIKFRDEGKNWIVLYDMRTFYVDVWYDENMINIEMICGFKNIQCLEPYLQTIKLPGILQ